jgi:hypothetical protein
MNKVLNEIPPCIRVSMSDPKVVVSEQEIVPITLSGSQ